MAKVVLITGATSGMGLETSILLALNGYTVYAGSRGNEDELLVKAKEKGVQINIVPLDVTQTQSIQQAVKSVIEKEGKIDVLVNNAGFGLLATLEEGTDEEIFKQFDVNVFGLIKTTREVLPYMREAKSGVIINISSFLGKMGLPLLSHYNASKYAVEGITDSLRFEVTPFNIRVHSVLAGLFGTNFVKKGLVANAKTTSDTSPYKELVAHFVPIVGAAINEGPSPMPIAQAIKDVIENENSDIAVKVGEEAETFVPLRKALSDKDFEDKIKETFGV
ncbi:MAG: SDR family oxidoreductase [Arcobacteraceae bacterium]